MPTTATDDQELHAAIPAPLVPPAQPIQSSHGEDAHGSNEDCLDNHADNEAEDSDGIDGVPLDDDELVMLGMVSTAGHASDAEHVENLPSVLGVVEKSRIPNILHICSGPERQGSYAEHASTLGMKAFNVDTVIDKRLDITSDWCWNKVIADVDGGKYAGAQMDPVCATFSPVRGKMFGPGPLRGSNGKELYGLPDLSPDDRVRVKTDTLIAIRCVIVAMSLYKQGKPFAIENPAPWAKNQPSMFNLDEFIKLASLPGVRFTVFVQCPTGSYSMKPTGVLHYLLDLPRHWFPLRCPHPKQWFRFVDGRWRFCSHPPLLGKQIAVPAAQWTPNLSTCADGFVSHKAARYTSELNRRLAAVMKRGVQKSYHGHLRKRLHAVKNSVVPTRKRKFDVTERTQVAMPERLHKRTKLAKDDDHTFIGGMRNSADACEHIDRSMSRKLIGITIEYLKKHPNAMDTILKAIGSDKHKFDYKQPWITRLRNKWARALGTKDSEPTVTADCSTPLRGGLLKAWAQHARDPALAVVSWLFTGAPAGIELDIPQMGIFPPKDAEDTIDIDELTSSYEEPHMNYKSLEEDSDADDVIKNIIDKDKSWVKVVGTWKEAVAYLGAAPIVSQLGLVVKERKDENGKITGYKKRLILDARRSRANDLAKTAQRITLPRPTDGVEDILILMDHDDKTGNGHDIEQLVADYVDAYWLMPLARSERKYQVAKWRGQYLIFLRTGQGTRASSLTWSHFSALVARLVQAGFETTEFRMQVYTDDPHITVKGSKERRDLLMAAAITSWIMVGLDVAFHKARRGKAVEWIGSLITVVDGGVHLEVKPQLWQEVRDTVETWLHSNVVSVRELRKLTGKANYIASLIITWRPFLADLWGALAKHDGQAKKRKRQRIPNTIWVKQIKSALKWIHLFLTTEYDAMSRSYCLLDHMSADELLIISTDASPWGLGGTLTLAGIVVAAFCSKLSSHDTRRYQYEIGSSRGQQTWEALAVLVALRLWGSHWRSRRYRLLVKSDSVVALVMTAKLKAAGYNVNRIAREVALDMGAGLYLPAVCEHVAGISNILPDALSRQWEPAGPAFPAELSSLALTPAPLRTNSFYKIS